MKLNVFLDVFMALFAAVKALFPLTRFGKNPKPLMSSLSGHELA